MRYLLVALIGLALGTAAAGADTGTFGHSEPA